MDIVPVSKHSQPTALQEWWIPIVGLKPKYSLYWPRDPRRIEVRVLILVLLPTWAVRIAIFMIHPENCAADEQYMHALSGHFNLAKVTCGRINGWEYKRKLDSIFSFSAVLQLTQHICWWDLCLGLLEEVEGLGNLFGGWLFFQGFGSDLRDPQGFCGCCSAYHKGRAWHRKQTEGWDAADNHTQWLACSSASALSYPK